MGYYSQLNDKETSCIQVTIQILFHIPSCLFQVLRSFRYSLLKYFLPCRVPCSLFPVLFIGLNEYDYKKTSQFANLN